MEIDSGVQKYPEKQKPGNFKNGLNGFFLNTNEHCDHRRYG